MMPAPNDMFKQFEVILPELSGKMLAVSVLYTLGTPYETIAEMLHISVETVKTYLKRSTKALNIETYDALRNAILLRVLIAVLNK